MGDRSKIRFGNKTSFDQYYRNSRNSIDDPIFTGFTFDIDINHSPLFFALAGPEYVESLRSESGTDTELSQTIENKLSDVYNYRINSTPDSYDINTLETKSKLGDRRAGYGLQDKYYMDDVLYGAVDYIYMVDKVSIGTYTDNFGLTDLGNGTTSNIFHDGLSGAGDLDGDGEISQSDIQKKIDEIKNSIATDSNKEEYDRLSGENGDVERLKKEWQGILNSEEYKDAKTKKEKLETDIRNQKAEVESTLSEYKAQADKYLGILRGSGEKEQTRNDVDNLYSKIFPNIYVDAFIKSKPILIVVKSSIKTAAGIQEEIEKLNLNEIEKQQNLDYFKKIVEIKGFKITEKTIKSEVETELNGYKKTINDKEKEIYGFGGTQANPYPGSIYYNYLEAQKKLNNNSVNIKNQQLKELEFSLEHYNEIEAYDTYMTNNNVNKQQVETNPSLSNIDVENVSDIYSRELYEVPQTVYDMMGFIKGMTDIIDYYPYTMESISGLDEAYKNYFELKDPYMGSGDNRITIVCNEYLDLKVSSMFNKYFNAVYDRQYRRERVPINLRRFQCSVFVHDIRNFKNSLNGGDVPGDLPLFVELALNHISAIEFKFYDCEIVPNETGSIFDTVTNTPANDMKKTNFTFTYGNCVINFLPFEDLKKYLLKSENIQPGVVDGSNNIQRSHFEKESLDMVRSGVNVQSAKIDSETGKVSISSSKDHSQNAEYNKLNSVDDGNFRRSFDRSVLGNVNNNDYREYVRNDSSTAVDQHFYTTVVNNFAMNSLVNKNKELTAMDDALRKIVTGISASTGIPVRGVTDALNIKHIDPILNERDLASPVVRNLGNVNNSKVVDVNTMEYIGKVDGYNKGGGNAVQNLGNVYDTKK